MKPRRKFEALAETWINKEPWLMARKRTDRTAMESVKLPADVMESARIVAAYTGNNIAELLGEILRPVLARMEQEQVEQRSKSSNAGKKP
jgi:hypothetical protein